MTNIPEWFKPLATAREAAAEAEQALNDLGRYLGIEAAIKEFEEVVERKLIDGSLPTQIELLDGIRMKAHRAASKENTADLDDKFVLWH